MTLRGRAIPLLAKGYNSGHKSRWAFEAGQARLPADVASAL
jgi:hypothetical protein